MLKRKIRKKTKTIKARATIIARIQIKIPAAPSPAFSHLQSLLLQLQLSHLQSLLLQLQLSHLQSQSESSLLSIESESQHDSSFFNLKPHIEFKISILQE